MNYFGELKGLTGAGTIALSCVGVGLLAAIGILSWQALSWLKTGDWQVLTLMSGLSSFGVDWASSPESWIGIHNLLKEIPLTVAVFWAWMIPALLLMLLHNWIVRRQGRSSRSAT
ncbi:MAG: hypothetical protein JSW48_06120 [Betaproteobacteria bacterium]|jgi:hypothetical protein|nr:MAG: hypothetical protein JSW48_06120 [Betaproteobacteria bacterium]